jgi:N-acetylmuramoyl-L-alanine amidase
MIRWIPYSRDWFIILHHSATKDGPTVSWDDIRRYHIKERNFADIGYHYGVEMIGNNCHVLMGRSLGQEGAHTVGMNRKSVGICFVGNYEIDRPKFQMYLAGIKLIAGLCYSLRLDPYKSIMGHKEYANTACPGKNFDISYIRDEVNKLL